MAFFRYNNPDLTRGMHLRAKVAVVALLLCATVAGQTGSLLAASEHKESEQHCCLLCHMGPLPLVQAAAPVAPTPLLAVAWLEPVPVFESAHDVALTARSSRAPPA